MFSERTTLQKLLLLKALSGGGQSLVERTALGNPLTFGTGVAKPLKSLFIPFTPQQTGSGDPSPENIRSILPWNGLTVFGGGKNLFNKETVILDKYLNSRGGLIDSPYGQAVTDYIPVVKGEKIIANSGTNSNYFFAFYESKNESTFVSGDNGSHFPFTVPDKAKYIRLTFDKKDIDTYQVEAGTVSTAYEPYHQITETDISFPSPVYGGTLDVVSGVLTVEWAIVDMGSLRWIANATSTTGIYRMSTSSLSDNIEIPSANSVPGKIVCSAYKTVSADSTYSKVSGIAIGRNKAVTVYDADYNTDGSVDDFITSVTGKMIAYKLETPQEITLTPEQITAIKGNNTVWSDADGSLTAVYLVSSKYADEHPVGGLGSGLGSGLLGSGTEDNPEDPADDPADDPIEDPEEEIPDNTEEGSEPDD